MKKNYTRNSKRYELRKELNTHILFDYMGEPMLANISDISTDGLGFTIEKEPFSVIDYEVLNLKISGDCEEITLPSRVLYSQKIGTSGLKRRYGVYFLSGSREKINFFLETNCEPQTREKR